MTESICRSDPLANTRQTFYTETALSLPVIVSIHNGGATLSLIAVILFV